MHGMKMKKIEAPDQAPSDDHYLLIIFETASVYVPGDERSRTNPGHGYPGGTEKFNTPTLYVSNDKNIVQHDLQKLFEENRNRKDLLLLHVKAKIPTIAKLAVEF